MEDRITPVVYGNDIGYSPKPIVIGQPATIKVEGFDGFHLVSTFTDSVTIYTATNWSDLNTWVQLGTHQFEIGDHGVFNIPVLVPLGTAPGTLSINVYDDSQATQHFSSVKVSDTGGNSFNLSLDNVEVPANDVVVPGEKTKFYLNLSNAGSSTCHGATTAHVTLGTDTIDVPITANIPAGGTEHLPVSITLPKLSLSGVEVLAADNYNPQVSIDPLAGETNTSDNSATAANPLEYAYRFGHVDSDPKITEKIKTDEKETFIMHGKGYADLIKSAGGWELQFSADTDASSWAQSTGGAKFTLTKITANKVIKGINMVDATAVGSLSFNGGLLTNDALPAGILVGNLGSGAGLTSVTIAHNGANHDVGIWVGEPTTPGSGLVQNTAISAADGIGALFVEKAWLGGSITTPFVTSISAGGDFSPDITVHAPGKDGDGIHEATIKGRVSGTWNAAPGGTSIGIGDVTVDSALGWTVSADGNVKRISVARDWETGNLSADAIGTVDVKGSLLIGDIKASGAFANGNGSAPVGIQTVHVGKTMQCTEMSADVASIGKLSAGAWLIYNIPPILSAKSMGTINVPGQFDASIDMTDRTAKSSLKSIKVGTVTGTANNHIRWAFDSDVGSIHVGSLSNVSIAATGNIGLFTQSMLPNDPVQFSNTMVSAEGFGLILVRNVDPANSVASGFKASHVLAYLRFNGHSTAKYLQHLTTGSYDSSGQYSLQIL